MTPIKELAIILEISMIFTCGIGYCLGRIQDPLKLDHAYPTFSDRENFRRRLDRTLFHAQ